jgi:integrase/recombinase XerC
VPGVPGPAFLDDARAAAELAGMLSPQVLRAHLQYLRLQGLSPTTIYQRRRLLARMCAQLGVPLLQATEAQLLAWREDLDVGDQAVVGYVCHARSFYAWAVDAGVAAANPAARVPVPRLGRRIPRPVGEPELLAAVGCAPARIRPWLVLAGWAGLRAKEIALLQRENVLDSARVPVMLIAEHATKGLRERVVPLCPFALAELHRASLPRAGYVFPRLDGGSGPNQPHLVSQLANRHLHDSGSAATLHQLRHRFGTQAYLQSLDLRMVQELLGHASPSTTAGYAAYAQADAARIVAALPVPDHEEPELPDGEAGAGGLGA